MARINQTINNAQAATHPINTQRDIFLKSISFCGALSLMIDRTTKQQAEHTIGTTIKINKKNSRDIRLLQLMTFFYVGLYVSPINISATATRRTASHNMSDSILWISMTTAHTFVKTTSATIN